MSRYNVVFVFNVTSVLKYNSSVSIDNVLML